MSTKKTTAKKTARKRTAKKVPESVAEEGVISEAVSSEAIPRKRAPRKVAKKPVEAESEGSSNAAPVAVEKSEAKEPIQGVRDARTQKPEGESHPTENQGAEEQQNNTSENDEGQQGRGRNRRGRRNRNKSEGPQPQVTTKVNTKDLGKKAWKVFLGEVSEEGLALIGDKEGRELAKRSFRLAEIFLEEEGRRVQPRQQQQRRRQPKLNDEQRQETPKNEASEGFEESKEE